jgi:hypothetical protein
MVRKKTKFNKSIELFHEHTGEVVRVIRFRNQTEFDDFLQGYKSMRYPGYNWRFCNINMQNKKTNEPQN